MRRPTGPMRSQTGVLADWTAEIVLAGYRGLGLALSPAMPLVVARRAALGKADRTRAGERYGHASLARPAGRLVWVHAASVGETIAVLPLVARLRDAGLGVVLTTITVTSAEIAAARLPPGALHQFAPFDIWPFVVRFLDHWRPDLAVFVEQELWPTIMVELSRREIPQVVVNGRLSERSFGRWRRVRALAAPLFRRIDLCLAQAAADGARFAELGARLVVVTGNVKWDAPPLATDAAEFARLQGAIGARPVWLAASTHEGEEAIAAATHTLVASPRPHLLTIVVPRHPARGDEIAAMLEGKGLTLARRSRGELPNAETDVYLADTLGELGLFFRVAPVAFIGNSLMPTGGGGHNPIEALRLSATALHGPAVANFAEIYAALDAADPSSQVADAASLATAVGALLDDPTARASRVRLAAAALAPLTGGLDRTWAALQPYLAAEAVAS